MPASVAAAPPPPLPPVRPLIDPRAFPLDRVALTAEDCARYNPQRGEFAQVTAILHLDTENNLIVAHRAVRSDEFWVPGHIPQRALFPGVLMIESMAQVAGLHACIQLRYPPNTFIGFGGVERFRFRGQVEPPCDLWIAGRITRGTPEHSIVAWSGQMMRQDGTIVCEGAILGVRFAEAGRRRF